MRSAPPVAFLGYVERFIQVPDGFPQLRKYNILGLKHIIVPLMRPLMLLEGGFAFALYAPQPGQNVEIRWRDPVGREIGTGTISTSYLEIESGSVPTASDFAKPAPGHSSLVPAPQSAWTFAVLPADTLRLLLTIPGNYGVFLVHGDSETQIGSLNIGTMVAAPMTPDRLAAIKSNPLGCKVVRSQLECSNAETAFGHTWALSEVLPSKARDSFGKQICPTASPADVGSCLSNFKTSVKICTYFWSAVDSK